MPTTKILFKNKEEKKNFEIAKGRLLATLTIFMNSHGKIDHTGGGLIPCINRPHPLNKKAMFVFYFKKFFSF